jgi:cytochrome bd-type quinol oxidase subunit 1
LYTVYGTYLTLVSGLKSVFHLIVIILIAMGAAIVAVWIAVAVAIAFGPFGVPAVIAMTATGIALTAVYLAIAIPMGIIANFLAQTMKISGLALLPSPPKR